MATKIMGIINVTPDSFFESSRVMQVQQAVDKALEFVSNGADIIDVGGESTRPGAENISEEEEIRRVLPVIQGIRKRSSVTLSIDTSKPLVAKVCCDAGAQIINDITGFTKPEMRRVAKETNATVCVMHMKGTPQTMQQNPFYANGVIEELIDWLNKQVAMLLYEGIASDKIVLDPGIGFGKTQEDNIEILKNVDKLRALGFPLLIGISRKSFLSRLLSKPTSELLFGTLACNTYLALLGVDILRVHDVKEHKDMMCVLSALNTKKYTERFSV